MLPLCHARLQQGFAKRIVTAARREGLAAEIPEELTGKQDKKLFNKEVAGRRGTSAKTLLNDEVTQKNPLMHHSIHSFMHWVIASLIFLSFKSLIHCFTDSLNRVLY